MDKRFLSILGVLVILFIGIFAISQHKSTTSTGGSSNSQATNHIEGQGQKGVTLVEYGDYECPICEAYYLPLKQAVAQYSADIHFQFSNLPLTAIHQNAFAAARAAEAAGLQNKFWEMHDKLYENQSQWVSSSDPQTLFNTYAQTIGLNLNQFKTDYASSKVNDAINADLAAFGKTGKDKATPTFFLDGVYLPNTGLVDPQTGAPTADKIAAAIQAEIAKKTSTSSSSNSTSNSPATTPSTPSNPY
jgi:protein-disulfide isomerase